jgi:hypothetical protein
VASSLRYNNNILFSALDYHHHYASLFLRFPHHHVDYPTHHYSAVSDLTIIITTHHYSACGHHYVDYPTHHYSAASEITAIASFRDLEFH